VLQRRLEDLVGRTRTQVGEVATLSTAEVAHRVATRLGLDQHSFAWQSAPITGRGGTQPSGESDRTGTAGSTGDATSAGASSATGGPGQSVKAKSNTRSPEQSSGAAPSLTLDQNALRKMDVALVQLDSCKQQSEIQGGLISNCREQLTAKNQIIDEQKASLAKLNEALGAKDQILARENEEHKAELKAARGTWTSRVARTVEMVGIGVAIGVAIRH
jgi:hypothetical protein